MRHISVCDESGMKSAAEGGEFMCIGVPPVPNGNSSKAYMLTYFYNAEQIE